MKKKLFMVIVSLSTLFMIGCTERLEITEEQSDVISDYMSSTVLKYQKNLDNKLITLRSQGDGYYIDNTSDTDDESQDNNSTNDNKTDSKSGEVSDSDDNKTDSSKTEDGNTEDVITVDKVLGLEDCKIDIISINKLNRYAEKGIYEIQPSKDKCLYQVKFIIENKSNKSVSLSSKNQTNIRFQLELDKNIYLPLLTAAHNDIMFLNTTIKPGNKHEAVLFYEVSKNINFDSAMLHVMSDIGSSTINIK